MHNERSFYFLALLWMLMPQNEGTVIEITGKNVLKANRLVVLEII